MSAYNFQWWVCKKNIFTRNLAKADNDQYYDLNLKTQLTRDMTNNYM